MSSVQSASRLPLRQLLRDALDPISDAAAWDRVLQRVNPLWSTAGIRARVVRRVDETPDTLSLWLKPNRHWSGYRAGQHVRLGVEINGVMRQRMFSLSGSNPQNGHRRGLLRLTIQRQPGSGVTDWLQRNAKPGHIVELGPAEGEFVLPAPTPKRVLMIAGGSGVTPMMAMLQQLARDRYDGDIVLVQLFRDADRRLFGEELASLGRQLPGLTVHAHDSAVQGRLPIEGLTELLPDLARRRTWLCGPEPLVEAVRAHWRALGLADRLQLERFRPPRPSAQSGGRHRVQAVKSEHVFTQMPGASLLEAAEAAGMNPKHGCRAGLCRTCLCRKERGTTRNLLTGLSSTQPDEWIQLCVSVAESDLDLAL
jgi:ferredoxin-NADP reductase